jgi:anti-sigma-K factor RsiG
VTTSTATRRPAARLPARRVEHLQHLGLQALRDYRQELLTEESRVSYWRRILQARLDTSPGDEARTPLAGLRSVLSKHQESSRRLSVFTVHDAVAVAPLPDLAVLWESVAGAGSDALLTRLAAAEAELSAYRRCLHERLDDATSELIARYRDEPGLALCALPLPRGVTA